ncbi:MAG TPA: ammonia-dependent NAD(+) synthetase [Gaiellaceae bacterium]
MTPEQEEIRRTLGVADGFDAAAEIERRVGFLVDIAEASGTDGFVLGISGGVDSTTAGRLCQLAAERIRELGRQATFVAMRLPYRTQVDEEDAQRALAFIRPDMMLGVDVGPATDALTESLAEAGDPLGDYAHAEFVRGNVKARERMIAQYAVANARNLLVVGTDHAAEAVTGFFTKHGDGACDVIPLSGLTKRRVRALAAALGAEDAIVHKVPTADLESDKPGLPDEAALGLTYAQIDDFLEGKDVPEEVVDRLVRRYRNTEHKRSGPIAP